MKKISVIMAIILCAATLFASMSFSVSANTDTLVCGFENGVKAYNGTSFLGVANATYFEDEKSAFFKPVSFGAGVCGALGDLSTGGSQPGVRRTQLYDLPQIVPAGNYELTIWFTDPVGLFADPSSDFGLLVTFHEEDMIDDDLTGRWFDDDYTVLTVKIVDNHGKAVKGDDYMDATMEASDIRDGNDGKTWTSYKANVTLDKDVAKTALWIYQPGGDLGDYDNQYQKAEGMQVYLDDLTLRSLDGEVFSGAPAEEDTTAAPADDTTAAPADDTTAAPADDTTAALADDTTAAPADDTTAVPADDTTADPKDEKKSGNAVWIALIAAAVAAIAVAVIIIIKKKKPMMIKY